MRLITIFLIFSSLATVLTSSAQPFPSSSNGDFSGNDTVGCLPLIVSFQSIIPNCVSWNWDFGNGNTSSQQNPTEIFQNSGTYTITLDVIYTNGDSATISKLDYISVVSKPDPNFTISSYQACENTNNLSFQNNTVGANQYLWDFGDGNLTTDISPSHHYSSSGIYTTTLIATNPQGCTENFGMSNIEIFEVIQNGFQLTGPSQVCDSLHTFPFVIATGGMTNCVWEFSDGTEHIGFNCQKIFGAYGEFDLLLITTDMNGCVDSTNTNTVVQVDNPPDDFMASSTENCTSEDITFNGLANGASSIEWDFGDGQVGSGLSVNHAYQNDGQYNVTMTTVHPNGCNQTIVKNNYVNIISQPNASVVVSDTIICTSEQIQFEGLSTNGFSINWDFGDGNNSTSASVSHQYLNPGLYNVLLELSYGGCMDTLSKNINVSQPSAQFQNDSMHSCSPVDVVFTSQTIGATSWEWNFSNGVTSTDQNPLIAFTSPGNYDASLIVSDSHGCSDTIEVIDAVTILNNTPSNFQSTEFSGCAPLSISFYNYVIGSGYWNWSFGDGSTSNSAMSSHIYTTPGDYVVSLESVDSLGCNIYIDTFALVTVNALTIDSIQLGLNCNDGEVIFTVDCPNCFNGEWNFGDGTTSSNFNSSHIYSLLNFYNISFTGVSNEGCMATSVYTVNLDSCTIQQLTSGSSNSGLGGWSEDSLIGINNEPQYRMCGPVTVSYYNPVPSAQSWTWDFGDGEIGYGLNPVHTYSDTGLYSLTLVYYDGSVLDTLYFNNYILIIGHSNNIVINSINTCDGFELSLSSQNSPFVNYFWSIDNVPLNNNSPLLDIILANNNELHSITLTTNDSSQCSYSASIGVVSNGFAVGFNMDSIICIGDSLFIEHTIPNGFQMDWIYEGNTISNDAYHVYMDAGVFEVSLEVTDSNGCVMNFNIGEVEVLAPISDFEIVYSSNLCVGDTLYVTATEQSNAFYNWNMGNATLITGGPNASAIVMSTGTFDIELETGANGCYSTTVESAVFKVYQAEVDFDFVQNNYCLPIEAQFLDQSISPVSWSWSFGDGNSSTIEHPNHTFISNPNGQITLEIVDINGCSASVSKNNIELFEVDIASSSSFGCAPTPISFTESSQNGIDWFWDFGDGTSSTIQNPTHTYTVDGTYNVSLIVTSAHGCTDTVSSTSMVEIDDVVANFTTMSGSGCAPQPAYFSDSSYNAVSWDWDFGNGFTSTLQNPIQIYYTGGNYSIQLIVESASGCTDTVLSPNPLNIIGPLSDFSIVDSTMCSYDSAQFIDNSQNADSYLWLFGDGNSSSSVSPAYQYATSGMYDISLITTDANGCQNIAMQSIYITQVLDPDVSFLLSDTIGCNPLSINGSTNSTGLQYQWVLDGVNVGVGASYNNTLSTGVYTLGLIAETQEGCIDTSLIKSIEVHFVYEVILDPINPVCEVENTISVSSSSFMGTWYIDGVTNPNNIFDISSLSVGDHVIMKEIATFCGDSDSVILHIDSMITAIINPSMAVCEYEAEFNLQSSSNLGYWSGSGITNPYTGLMDPSFANHGNNVLTYTIINGACTFTDSTIITVNKPPSSMFSLNSAQFCEGRNIQIISPENESTTVYSWVLENENDTIISTEITPDISLMSGNWNIVLTTEDNGCTSTNSVINLIVYDTIAPNTPSIIRSTVSGNAVLTEWVPPQYGMEKIKELQIWRSTDSINFSMVDVVETTATSYIDEDAKINDQNYYYLIIPTNVCNVLPEKNLMSSSILLEKEEINGEHIKFTWSEYFQWQYGVDYYELQNRNKDGIWETIQTIDSSSHYVIIEKP